MKTTRTAFQVIVNRELFASANVDSSGQLEISIVSLPGDNGAVLDVSASEPEVPQAHAGILTDSKNLSPGDTVTIKLEEVSASFPTEIRFRSKAAAGTSDPRIPVFCSFCGNERSELRKMVGGPRAFICHQCIEMCHEIVHET